MNCAELDWGTRGSRPLSAAEQAHLSDCERCRSEQALWIELRDLAGAGPSAELDARIQRVAHAALAAAPRPRSWVVTWIGASAAALGLFAGVALALHLHLRPDLSHLPWPALALALALLAGVFGLAGRASLRPGLAARGRWLAVGLAGLAALSLLACPACPSASGGHGARCFAAILALSAAPLLAFFALVRTRSRAWLTGACAGLAAGALGEAALLVHCPAPSLSHILGAHLLAWPVLALAGALLVVCFPARIWKPGAANAGRAK